VHRLVTAALLGVVLVLAACSGEATIDLEGPRHGSSPTAGSARTTSPEPEAEPLRPGERFVEVKLPTAYTPHADHGTDDYHCFLVDPGFAEDVLVTGNDVVPDNADLVHHVIVYRVEKSEVGEASALAAADPGPGWSCFGGGPGLSSDAVQQLQDAPWLGAWAPGGGERVMDKGIGMPVSAGSQVVVQMHYNLLGGGGTDRSLVRFRVIDDDGTFTPLSTMLVPAPVELPCREEGQDRLCYRSLAVADVKARFGEEAGSTADRLHLLCGESEPGPTQSCTLPITEEQTIRAAAGHMHLLGRSITITVNKGRPDARRVLDVPVWDFDDQGSIPTKKPIHVGPGDDITVTCTHDQSLRDQLPALSDIPERYVVWGEGTSDEMCLGIVLSTRP
jgi:hypothetical protein